MYIINYPSHIPLLEVFLEYQQHSKNKGIDVKINFAKSDGYPMERVQLETTIDKLEMRHMNYLYACMPNGLDQTGSPGRLETHRKTECIRTNQPDIEEISSNQE